MILFADTSALVKLYIEEAGSSALVERARRGRLAASVLAYAEIYATFARRSRESHLSDQEQDELVERFEREW